YFGAVSSCEGTTGRLQFSRTHVVGGRVGEIAAERDAFDNAAEIVAIDAVGDDKVDLASVSLAVASELVGGERKRERRQPRVVGGAGKAMRPGGKRAGHLPGPEAIFFPFGLFDPEQPAGELSVCSRQKQQPARFRLETASRDKGASTLADFLLD